MNWYYNGKEITDVNDPAVPIGAVGFVYKVKKYLSEGMANDATRNTPYTLNLDLPTKIYIGKKSLQAATKKKVGKREAAKQLAETGDKRKVQRVIRGSKVSNWMKYQSSCKPLIEEMNESPELFRKEILCFCFSKKELSYRELQQQFKHNVLEVDSYNDNLLGKFFRKDLIKPQQ